MQEDILTETINAEETLTDKRRHPRTVFTYPVEFRLFSQKNENIFFSGYLKDISIGGACLEFEDRYGRFSCSDAENAKVKLSLSIPRENKVNIFAYIQWTKKIEKTLHIKIGIAFKDLDYGELAVIEKLTGLKNKDHNMMWTLWEQYDQ